MKKSSKIPGITTAAIGFAALVACGGPSYDPNSPEGQAFELRHSIMEEAGERMELINNMAREQIPVDEAAFTEAAVELADLASRMPEGFEIESPLEASRSDPAIWSNKADFDSRMQMSIEATAALAEAAQNEGFESARALVVGNPTTSSTCSGCHNTYRLSDDD